MKSFIFVPEEPQAAGAELRRALTCSLDRLTRQEFIRAWSSIAYLFPGLHPDGFEDAESGWPPPLRRFVAEAWRRAETGDLADDELYPSDAQWAGIYDRMTNPTPEETGRRQEIAALSAECAHV